MWTNKHVVIALLIAPILALIAYFAVDAMVAERPQAAEPGAVYRLAAQSNCRYGSGRCTLSNGDMEVRVRLTAAGDEQWLVRLESRQVLQQAALGAAREPGGESEPTPLAANDGSGRVWSARLAAGHSAAGVLHITVTAAGSRYVGEAPLTFVQQAENPRR